MLIFVILPLLLIIVIYIILKLIVFMPAVGGENSIASLETVTIGGIDQTMLIRSEDTSNPILLYLHSGPGATEMVSFRSYHHELEKHFTVVIWEQRGTGKSYDSSMSAESMTIDTMVSDAGKVIQYLLDKFRQKKLFVVGHSWGSLLGVLTAQKYPESIYAYVGSGQEVNPTEGEKISYEFALDKATALNNMQAIKELNKINSENDYLTVKDNPSWYDDLIMQRKWLVKFGGETYNQSNSFLIVPALLPSEYTLGDFIRFGQGVQFSLKTLWPQIMQINFMESASSLSVPVFFLQGRHDYNTPASLVEDYYNALYAPYKELIWFENSAHHPMYEEAKAYDQILIDKLLPLAE
jgi:pimeloyl-ACP methyl ester carboxylesterase